MGAQLETAKEENQKLAKTLKEIKTEIQVNMVEIEGLNKTVAEKQGEVKQLHSHIGQLSEELHARALNEVVK